MGQAEVAGIVHDQRPFWERQRRNFGAVRPVLGNVDLVFGDVAGDEPGLHVLTQHDDAVGIAAGPVRERANEAR